MTRKTRVTTEIVMVTPEMAAKWLEPSVNNHNRPLKPKRYGFSRDMRDNNWIFNGATIAFCEDGTLQDGQNRLWAIEDSNTSQLMIIVRGLPAEAQETIDQGTPRSHGDILHLSGEKNAEMVSTVAGLLVPLTKGIAWARSYRATYAEKRDLIEGDTRGIMDAVELALHARYKVPAAPSAIGAAYYLCALVNPHEATLFFETKLIRQIGYTEGEPALVLRQRFEKHRTDKRRIDADEVIRLTIMAYNHWRRGTQITKLQGPKGGWSKDNFPKPI